MKQIHKTVLIFIFFLGNCSSKQEFSVNVIRNIPDNEKKSVFFIDFENNSVDDKIQWDGLRRAIPAMIITDFKNFGVFKSIPERERIKSVHKFIKNQNEKPEEEKIKAANATGADYMLLGSFIEKEGIITISMKLTNVLTKQTEYKKEISGPTKQILNPPDKSLIKQSSLGLLSQMKLNLLSNESDLLSKDIETTELNAAINNYSGEMYLEKAEYLKTQNASSDEISELEDNARSKFKAAIKNDPKYLKAKANLGRIISLLPPIY